MNRSQILFLLFSLCSILLLSCSSDYRYLRAVPTDETCVRKIAPAHLQTSWYHASIDVIGKHISGLLLIKNMPDSSDRVVFTSEAGVTFFDFGFASDGSFKVYTIIKQFDRNPVIRTLRKDFELTLGLPFEKGIYQSRATADELYFGVTKKNETAYFITSKDCSSLRRLELGSLKKKKVSVSFGGTGYPLPETIELTHYTFDMQIKLTRFEKE
jgi:hypothetical protein